MTVKTPPAWVAVPTLMLVLAAPASAKPDDAPRFLYLLSQDVGDVSALSARCELDEERVGEALCWFTQTRVSLKTEPADIPKKLEEARKEAGEFIVNGKPTPSFKKLCEGLDSPEAREKTGTLAAGPTKSALDGLAALCAKPSLEAIMKWIALTLEQETRTCRISVMDDEQPKRFVRVSPTKWIHQSVSGLCNSAITIVLEREAKSDMLWTYTQTRTSKDDGDLCAGLQVGRPFVYSWRGTNPMEKHCESFEFGL